MEAVDEPSSYEWIIQCQEFSEVGTDTLTSTTIDIRECLKLEHA